MAEPAKRAPRKRAAKAAPAGKKAPAKKATQRSPKRARQRAEGRPGPLPIILRGFKRTMPSGDPDTPDAPGWAGRVPAAIVLAALRAGATWELAARTAHLNQATPREWNTRGHEILNALPVEGAELDRTVPDETVAYLHFHLEAEAARGATVVSALTTIDRAARQTKDQRLAVTAAELILKRHPEAKPYRPDPRLELTGPEGGPIPITVRDEAKAKLEGMAKRLAENAQPEAPPVVEPVEVVVIVEEPDDDPPPPDP